jgi:hypothetical protein
MKWLALAMAAVALASRWRCTLVARADDSYHLKLTVDLCLPRLRLMEFNLEVGPPRHGF